MSEGARGVDADDRVGAVLVPPGAAADAGAGVEAVTTGACRACALVGLAPCYAGRCPLPEGIVPCLGQVES